jgi:MOSC domain-containing protein
MHIGTVAALWRYPVKSLQREELTHATVLADGIEGDRTRALIVANPDHARAGKPLRGKEHNRLHTISGAENGVALAGAAGVTVDIAPPDRYFDARPVSIIFNTWIADVEVLTGRTIDPQRYRPNIFAQAAPDFYSREEAMIGTTLAIGTAIFMVTQPIHRCVTTTYDVTTGESDPNILREVALNRENTVGIYCIVMQPGNIDTGADIRQS